MATGVGKKKKSRLDEATDRIQEAVQAVIPGRRIPRIWHWREIHDWYLWLGIKDGVSTLLPDVLKVRVELLWQASHHRGKRVQEIVGCAGQNCLSVDVWIPDAVFYRADELYVAKVSGNCTARQAPATAVIDKIWLDD